MVNLRWMLIYEEEVRMVNEKIENLKEELNELVANNASFEEIYRVSKLIDKYLIEYYK